MPVSKPDPSPTEVFRGRNPATKCLFCPPTPVGKYGVRQRKLMKEEEWLGGKNEGNDVGVCCCGYKIENEGDTRQASISIRIDSYPPYLGTFAREPILVKGSTSRRIMQLLELDVPIPKIAQKLAKRNSAERYTTIEVQSVIHTCSLLGLKGDSPYATESWENESIEGWWLKEDSYCESLLREQPITEKDCGYDCDDGWWKGRQCAGHRDWNRWACCSIGPEERRRERYRLYDLYGSDALRTGSDGSD